MRLLSRKQLMQEAAAHSPAVYMKIVQHYKQDSMDYFVVAEAGGDLTYYSTRLQDYAKFPKNASVREIPSGGRSEAIRAFNMFKSRGWRSYDPSRILFFVDRDYPEFRDFDTPDAVNFYETDGYAIENLICKKTSFMHFVQDRWSGNLKEPLDYSDLYKIEQFHDEAIDAFKPVALEIMVYEIGWKRKKLDPTISDFKLKQVIDFKEERIYFLKDLSEIRSILAQQCKINSEDAELPCQEKNQLIKEIEQRGSIVDQIRGKYLDELYVKLIRSLPEISVSAKGHFKIPGFSSALEVLKAGATIPQSLKMFFEANLSHAKETT